MTTILNCMLVITGMAIPCRSPSLSLSLSSGLGSTPSHRDALYSRLEDIHRKSRTDKHEIRTVRGNVCKSSARAGKGTWYNCKSSAGAGKGKGYKCKDAPKAGTGYSEACWIQCVRSEVHPVRFCATTSAKAESCRSDNEPNELPW